MANSLIICNWKMYFSYHQILAWLKQHHDDILALSHTSNHTLVLCPSYDALSYAMNIYQNTSIAIGAQDCSAYKEGAYTGQIQAKSLKEIGCSYVIIGHSETRTHLHVTTALSVLKTKEAITNNLIPIVCVGETKEQCTAGNTLSVIDEQLHPILALYTTHNAPLVIAYEPVWSIGTGITPDKNHLQKVYTFIQDQCNKHKIQNVPKLLYGGSVDENTLLRLKDTPLIQGYLIGRASTDFQKLKKIVKLI